MKRVSRLYTNKIEGRGTLPFLQDDDGDAMQSCPSRGSATSSARKLGPVTFAYKPASHMTIHALSPTSPTRPEPLRQKRTPDAKILNHPPNLIPLRRIYTSLRPHLSNSHYKIYPDFLSSNTVAMAPATVRSCAKNRFAVPP